MSSAKLLISLPHDLASRWKAAVPPRKRSRVLRHLIENEIKRCEQKLYQCAQAVEKDEALAKEMKDWDVTLNDGIKSDESW